MAVTMRLPHIPNDVFDIILAEQCRMKKFRRINQLSMVTVIYALIREYSKLAPNKDFELVPIPRTHTKQIYLRKIPADIYKIIITEQNRIKEITCINQFSMERTIYHIIREYAKIKSCHNAL